MSDSNLQIDTHAHAFTAACALVPGRRYTPDQEAPLARYLGELDQAGIDRGVLIQPSFLGTDNSYLLACLAQSDRLRGVAVIDPAIDDKILAIMNAAGIVGMRLNLLGMDTSFVREDSWQDLFGRVARLGWHIELHALAKVLPTLIDALWFSGAPIVVDHFGRPDPEKGLRDPGILALFDKAKGGQIWIKFSAPYRCEGDANAYAAAFLERFGPRRIIWGSDFPWTQHSEGMSYRQSRDWLDAWIPDPDMRRQVLGPSAARLFNFVT